MAAPAPYGMYAVTQYIPAANINSVQQMTILGQTPNFFQKFIKGEPKTLGAIQVAIGLLQIGLGGILCTIRESPGSIIIYSGVPFWTAVFYITSGSLSISAEKSGSRGQVQSCLALNIVSIKIAGAEIIVVAIDLGLDSGWRCSKIYIDESYFSESCGIRQGIVSLLLLLTALEFCIAFSTSVFGCTSVCCPGKPVESQAIFPVQNPMGQAVWVPVPHMESTVPAMPAQQGGAPPLWIPATIPAQQGGAPPHGIPAVPMQQGGAPPQGTQEPPPPTTTPSYYLNQPGDSSILETEGYSKPNL